MEYVSKTQKKKEALALQDLGERLVELKDEQLRNIKLPEDLYEAVVLAKSITKHVPRLRQMQYIGTLMRRHDSQPIQDAITRIDEGRDAGSALHKQVEEWRDQLIAGEDQLILELVAKFPLLDQTQLTELVRKAREERVRKSPSPTAARAVFRYLHKLTQAGT
jgi:ribosome-associated protein